MQAAVFRQPFGACQGQIQVAAAQHFAHQSGLPCPPHQGFACGVYVGRGLNQRNHFVNIGQRNGLAFGDMPFGARFFQAEQGAARNDFAAVAQKFVQNLLQIQQARLAVHQRNHIDAERVLQLREFVQLVQHHFGVFAAFELDDDARAVFVGFVAQLGNAFHGFFAHQFADFFHQLGFVDLIRDFIDHNRFAFAVFANGFDVRFAADDHAAAAGLVARADAG